MTPLPNYFVNWILEDVKKFSITVLNAYVIESRLLHVFCNFKLVRLFVGIEILDTFLSLPCHP